MNGDPELASEVVGCLSRELKAARKRVDELESQLEHSKQVRFFFLASMIAQVTSPQLTIFSSSGTRGAPEKPRRCEARKQKIARHVGRIPRFEDGRKEGLTLKKKLPS